MRSKDAISSEAFDTLLGWLDPDRNEAGKKYEVIRRALIKMFVNSGCLDGENLADQTIDRVSLRINDIRDTYHGDPALYFYGVGHKLRLEYHKTRREDNVEVEAYSEAPASFGSEYECLKECLGMLPENQRELILDYHLYNKTAKIECRRSLAAELGIEVNTLRLRAHRIRHILENCVEKCLKSRKQ
jgi:DNA-directed RNA polymerase specialized sigma24 family protein